MLSSVNSAIMYIYDTLNEIKKTKFKIKQQGSAQMIKREK